MQLLVQSLALGTPDRARRDGGAWCERSGVVNIGIEGMMLMSAATGFLTYAVSATGRTRPPSGSPSGWPSSPAG